MTPPARYWRSICSSENGTTSPWRTSSPSSTTTTSRPASASSAAVGAPPAPEPTTSTSAGDGRRSIVGSGGAVVTGALRRLPSTATSPTRRRTPASGRDGRSRRPRAADGGRASGRLRPGPASRPATATAMATTDTPMRIGDGSAAILATGERTALPRALGRQARADRRRAGGRRIFDEAGASGSRPPFRTDAARGVPCHARSTARSTWSRCVRRRHSVAAARLATEQYVRRRVGASTTSPPACVADAVVGRIHVLAWRDLDDPDAGGSEVHADELMTRWAAAGLDILHRTSAAVGPAGAGPASRLRGDPARQPLQRCSRGGGGRGPRADGPLRRPRRDLERRAVVLAAVVPPAAADDRAPRPRPDVGPGHAPTVRRDGPRRWRPASRRRSTGAAPR